jgi:hypothetical protein
LIGWGIYWKSPSFFICGWTSVRIISVCAEHPQRNSTDNGNHKISATIAARIAIFTAFFITKNVIAATANKKITKIIAAISII